jgi:hypothetical protein
MTLRKSLLLLISLSMIAALVACSSSSSTPPPPPPAITVTLTSPTTFPAILYVNDTLSVTATVANDSAQGGVIWSCTPGNSAATCGSFSSGANAAASGTAVTYTAPAGPVGAVTITATSVTDSTKSASSSSIAINATVISVTITTAPPSSMFAGANATVAATVTGDPAGLGVNWSCTPANACGSFNPTSTASAANTTYTAPSTAGNVTIVATSISDDTQSASAAVTVNAALVDGNYVYSLSGEDDFGLYDLSGVFVVSGGAITGGEQDFVDYDDPGNFTESDQINGTLGCSNGGSCLSSTPDGNLQITLVTCNRTDCTSADTNIGNDGVETLAASVLPLNPNKALITEFDLSATSSGTLDFQTSTAAPVAPVGYAFGLNGLDSNGNFLSMGGVIDIDSAGTISGAGSIFDANDDMVDFQMETFATSTVMGPDGMGRLTFTLNPADTGDFPNPIILIGYIVDANHIRLVESFDGFQAVTGGTALGQGTNTGNFSSSSVSGNSYVVGLSGLDNFYILQAAGLFTLNSDGTVSGFINYNDLSGLGPQTPSPITAGTYTVDNKTSGLPDAGTGRVTLTGVTDGVLTTPITLQFYLDGNGKVLAASMDTTDVLGGSGAQQTGAFTAGSFSGAYAMDVTGWDTFGDEFDAVGPVTATPSGSGGAFSGAVDLNGVFTSGNTFPAAPVSGTFASNADGIFTGTVTGVDITSCTLFGGAGCSADVFVYYLIDATGDNIAIETDTNQLTLGVVAQQ